MAEAHTKVFNLYKQASYEDCIVSLDSLLPRGDTYFMVHTRGLCQKALGRISQAVESFSRALAIDPSASASSGQLAKCYALLGRHGDALRIADAAIDRAGAESVDSKLWYLYQLRGACLHTLGRTDAAFESLFRAYDISPNLQTKRLIGELQVEMGQTAEALETFTDILVFSPNDTHILLELGKLHAAANDSGSAFECFSRAAIAVQRQLDSQSTGFASSNTSTFVFAPVFFALGSTMQALDPKAALVKYRVAGGLTGASSDAHLWVNLAQLFMSLNKLSAALVCAKRAFILAPNSMRVRHALGFIYTATGDFNRGFQLLSAALAGSDETAEGLEILWLLGVCAGELEELKLAHVCLRKAAAGGLYGACVAGFALAVRGQSFDLAAEYSNTLSDMSPDCDANYRLAKQTLKLLKKALGSREGEAAGASEEAPEGVPGEPPEEPPEEQAADECAASGSTRDEQRGGGAASSENTESREPDEGGSATAPELSEAEQGKDGSNAPKAPEDSADDRVDDQATASPSASPVPSPSRGSLEEARPPTSAADAATADP